MFSAPARRTLDQSSPNRILVRRGRGAWLAAFGCLAVAVFAPGSSDAAVALGFLCAAIAVVAGCRAFGVGRSSLWATLAAFLVLQASVTVLDDRSRPVAMVGALAAIGLYVETLRRLGRRGRIDRGSLTDAGIVSAALIAVMADLLWVPMAIDGLTTVEVSAIVGSATEVAVLTQLAYALLANGSLRLPAMRLISAGVTANALVHLLWALPERAFDQPGAVIGVTHLAAVLVMAAGALHPSMARLGAELPPHPHLTDVRIGLLGLCGLAPMVLLLLDDVRGDRPAWPLGLCGVVLVCLLVARLGRALAGRDDDHRREVALKAGLTALVVATDNTTIELAVVLAARNLLEDRGATIRLLGRQPSLTGPVSVFGPGFRSEPPLSIVQAVHADAARPWLVCIPVPSSNGPDGVLAAAVGKAPSTALLEAFQTLAGQLGLARERAAMAASMHRRHAEHRLAALVQNAFDVITILDEHFTVQFQSPSITAVLGHHPEEVALSDFRALVQPDDVPNVEAQLRHLATSSARSSTRIDCRLRHRSDDYLDVEITATNLLSDPDVSGLVLNIRDVSERKTLEQQLIRQAFHDPLTGLANRVLLADRVEHALQVTSRGGPEPAVLFIDLDDFKMINDSLGHPAGDRLLVELADRLTHCLRPGDTAARMGGDEFAVLLENAGAATPEALAEVAERVLERLGEPLMIDGTEISPRASIGVASGSEVTNAADLLRNADLAMYIAKAQGGGVALFEPSMHDSARRRLELQAELARALDRNEFEVHFQPIVALHDPSGPTDPDALIERPSVMGVEALVRWNHPQRGRIPPLEFIPLAEETGMIVALGRWVLIEACRTVASWAREGLTSSLSLTVNMSARQLQETGLIDDVALAIASSGIDPSWLVIEITESVVMHDTEASVRWLHALKQLGVRIAIDDFGTGYSSLAYLQLFPIDVMKIDRSFVIGLGTDPKATELVRAVINLSDSLGMTTLAEGIETVEQLTELQGLGCRLGQGFAFAKPMSSGALITAVEDGALTMARPGPWHPRTPAVGPGSGPERLEPERSEPEPAGSEPLNQPQG